ncbi:acyltransferase family protein [Xylanibacter ruminicola]|uniref:Fucose 4-O-acetylase n=1 Tax=Xylanibacter ruminicola TaxID=839 RepID=A0A1M6RAC6_XYLRU|nr:acyltransferase family protein [Xylanibacter ruminicola]SHK29435.1 Fucose 4-O-acetylase [Xylanibacter ruminicola]
MLNKSLKQKAVSGMKLQSPKVRDERVDSVKFWLVVLVITAHVIMRKEFVGSTACVALWNWLCLFAMPLFVFISGNYSRKKDWKTFWPSIWTLLEPLIIFQAIGLLFYVGEPLSVRTILTPWYMLWYLLSLIYWRLMLQVIPDSILRHTKLVLITTFSISIMAGFLPFDRLLSIQRTLALMPFFFLGYYMKGRNLYLPDKYKLLCVVFLIAILTILFFYPHRINDLKFATPYKSFWGAAIRMIAFGLAVPMSIAFINVCYKAPWVAQQGKISLQYYIYHALLIPPMSAPIIPPLILIADKMNVPMTFYTAFVITIITTIGLSFILKNQHVKMFTNPSLFFVKKEKL